MDKKLNYSMDNMDTHIIVTSKEYFPLYTQQCPILWMLYTNCIKLLKAKLELNTIRLINTEKRNQHVIPAIKCDST